MVDGGRDAGRHGCSKDSEFSLCFFFSLKKIARRLKTAEMGARLGLESLSNVALC